ncbi:MAG TPA: efflux RND transporter periplasmic adaptor subunit [Agriterribacter sp.]|nr:efflux RND transporter periplasmic adaptor subunit [Agriterribacter sp.]
MNTSYSIAPVFVFPLLAGLLSCGGGNKSAANAGDAAKDYPVIAIEPRATILSSDYPATIEGRQNIEIRPKIDGYIDKIYVDEGAAVKRGQVLFKIFAPQYEQDVRTAQANIKIAEANVNAAEMEVNKVRPLVDKNIISKYELESAEFSLESKQAALAQAQASLVNAKVNLGYTAVTSPVNGVIGNLPYKIGSLVSSNTALPLTTVSNIDSIYAYFSINEKQALEFATTMKGATAAERLKSIPPVTLVLATGMIFPEKGHIETASGLINTETGSVRVRATFPNPGSMVRSGSSGIVRIPANLDAAILVPQKSTYEIQGKKFVYLLDSAGTVKSVEIRIRQNTGGQYFVVEEGLKPGDKIILEGVATLREGAPVIPREVSADSVFNRGK